MGGCPNVSTIISLGKFRWGVGGNLDISLSEPEYLAKTSDNGTYSKQLERVRRNICLRSIPKNLKVYERKAIFKRPQRITAFVIGVNHCCMRSMNSGLRLCGSCNCRKVVGLHLLGNSHQIQLDFGRHNPFPSSTSRCGNMVVYKSTAKHVYNFDNTQAFTTLN